MYKDAAIGQPRNIKEKEMAFKDLYISLQVFVTHDLLVIQ